MIRSTIHFYRHRLLCWFGICYGAAFASIDEDDNLVLECAYCGRERVEKP